MEGSMACSGVRLRGSFERLFRPLGFGAGISLMPIDCREHSSSTEGDRIADEERVCNVLETNDMHNRGDWP
jgi:hypothetical protein